MRIASTGLLAVFILAVLFTYGVFFTGHPVSGDNIVQFYQTTQILDRGRLTFRPEEASDIVRRHDWGLDTRFSLNRDGLSYSQAHGIGQPLMTLPLFAAMRLAKRILGLQRPADMTLWALNWPIFSAAAVVFVLAICRLVKLSAEWSTLITLGAAFSSPLWMYSDAPYNVLGEVVLILAGIALCLWLDGARPGSVRQRCGAAAALALLLTFTVLVRPFAATAIPAFVAWVLMAARSGAPERSGLMDRRHVRVFLGCLLTGAAAVAVFNTYYFGSPMATAYHHLQGVMNFNGRWLEGVSGTFLSPLKSPLYFFPLSVLFPAALAVVAWRRESSALFVVLFMLPQIFWMPKYSLWDGGPDLFARFWLRALPAVFLTLALAARDGSSMSTRRRASFAAVVILTLLGTSAQFRTSMTDERVVYAQAASILTRRSDAQGHALQYQDTPVDLLMGRTIVASTQRAAANTPRSFLFFRESPHPSARLWAAVLGLLVATGSLYACCVVDERMPADSP